MDFLWQIPEGRIRSATKLYYIRDVHSFDYAQPRLQPYMVALIIVGEIQIEVEIDTGLAIGVLGYAPLCSWEGPVHLHMVEAEPGALRMVPSKSLLRGVAYDCAAQGEWIRSFDETTGWFLVRDSAVGNGGQYVEFGSGMVAQVAHGHLAELWLRPVFLSH